MSESARFELVEGATFQLPDGSSVTVRDGQLELSDGRRLPMPAAGEAITVERTVTRPDGGTTRIKHTIRLSDTEPVVETPARPFAGAGPGEEEDVKEGEKKEVKETEETEETVPAPVVSAVAEAAPAAEAAKTDDEKDSGSEAQKQSPDLISDVQMPDAPAKEPAAAASEEPAVTETPVDHTLMGVNCGRRSLRDMLWGSIPESGFGEDEDEPKAPPKGLLNKSYSIKEEDESEDDGDDGTHEEAVGSSENADESFEFVEGKGKDAEKGKESEEQQKESEPVKEPENKEEDKMKENDKEPEKEASEKEEGSAKAEPEKEESPKEVSTEPVQDDSTTKVPTVSFNTFLTSESAPQQTDDTDKKPSDQPSSEDKPETKEEPSQESAPESPSTELLAEQAAAVMATTASLDQPTEPQQDKPHLVRQEKLPSSGNLVAQTDDIVVRVGVPVVDAAPQSKPAEAAPAPVDSNEESTASPSSEDAAPAAPLSDEVTHDLHLKLTPILRSLETDEPKSAAADDGERAPKAAPSEDRKGTVPPNTPAVIEDRDCLPSVDDPEAEEEPVSVPKVVSYYESISPRASPAPSRPRDSETSAVPKVIKFAVPMEPEKIDLGGQEPEEMEDIPIPRPAEQPAHVELSPEPAALQPQTQVLIPVQAVPEGLDPLSALVVTETSTQPPSAPEEKSDDPATPSTTPEKETTPDPAQDAAQNTAPTETDQPKPAPPVYNPELFEPEPKRPLILTSEMVDEDAPPYEPGVHDARTLPMARKTAVVTEQPPPFGDDDRTDPRDPFLPDKPRPGAGLKDDGFLTTCFDLCCCCWAP